MNTIPPLARAINVRACLRLGGHATMLGLMVVALAVCPPVHGVTNDQQALARLSAEQLLAQSRDAYTVLDRNELSKALVAKGVAALPTVKKALENKHWHVRHCALTTIREWAKAGETKAAVKPLVPTLAKLLLNDPALGVRLVAAECLGSIGERGNGVQEALATAAIRDKDPWVCAAASAALTAVQGELPVMIPVFDTMIRSTDKQARGNGIGKAAALHAKGIDITPLVPALLEVFRAPIYDANFSGQTRAPAMNLLIELKVDTSPLVPFIVKDLRTAWKLTEDGYHPYQVMTLEILGRMGANGEAAIPALEEVIADPSKFGCSPTHPDYPRFISRSKESIEKIRAAIRDKKGAK